MKQNGINLLLLSAALLLLPSCGKEMFDEEVYNGFVDYQFMIDNVDREHDWCLTQSGTMTVSVPSDVYTVQLLTANPYESASAEIAAAVICQGQQATLHYTIPIVHGQLYLAALTAQGNYMGVMPVAEGTETVALTYDQLSQKGTLTRPANQTFTYLYEVDFPYPGDFDYNDMVLRISKQPGSSPLEVDLSVTLQAVGAATSYAAAIQLAGVPFNNVEKIELISGAVLDENYPFTPRYIESQDLLIRGRSKQAVIRLFESCQWVFNKTLNELGLIDPMLYYNTTRTALEEYSAVVPPVTNVYRITFTSAEQASAFSFDNIDPFIIHTYNNAYWEVHTYAHKFDEVFWAVFGNNKDKFDNHISWSIVVPKADFRYPTEGISLSSFNETTEERFGPYNGFSYWMQDHTQQLDWYLRPSYSQLLY